MDMRGKLTVLVASVVVLLAGTVHANSLGTVRMKYHSATPRKSATIYLNGNSLGTVYTGQYNLLLDADYTPTGEGEDVYELAGPDYLIGAFCADVRQSAPLGKGYYLYDVRMPEDGPVVRGDPQAAMGESKANDLRRLYGSHIDEIGTEAGAAAFQLCVWEIIDDSGYDVTSGSLYTTTTGAWVDMANTWLEDLGTTVPDVELRILTNEDMQDYALVFDGPSAPEPITVAGILMGLGAAGAYVRKRRVRTA